MGEPAIAVTGLRKSFGPKEAVAGIDLEIAAGSLAGLVGPNGAGKTTSLSMMTGLLRPDGGQVLINGIDVWADQPGQGTGRDLKIDPGHGLLRAEPLAQPVYRDGWLTHACLPVCAPPACRHWLDV